MIVKIAWRSIWRNRRRTLLTVASIGFGLAFAIYFISMGEGMYSKLIDQVVRMQAGHITFEHPGYREAPAVDLWVEGFAGRRKELESWPSIKDTKLIVMGQGIAKSGAGNVGAAIMGIEPSREMENSPLARNITEGAYLDDQDEALVVVGSKLAKQLNLKVGKKLVLTTNDIKGDLVEELCRVKGIFRTGSDEIDSYFIQAPLDFTRRLFRIPKDGATQVGILLKNADQQKKVLRKIREKFQDPGLAILPWQEVMVELSSYIKADRGSNIIFQGILIFLILFTIFNTILMSVMERQREFAVLLALGTEPGTLRTQIVIESAFLGLLGCLFGLALGSLASYLTYVYGIDLSRFLGEGINISGFAMDTTLRTKLTVGILFGSSAIVFTATILLSLIPVRRATKMNIVEMLR